MVPVIDNLEVKPTLVAFCMCIYSQIEIILILANLECQVKVSTFEISNKLNIVFFVQLFLFFFYP